MIKEYALVPTGPTNMIDMQRTEAGAKKYFEDSSRGILISGIWDGEGKIGQYYKSQPNNIYSRLGDLEIPNESISFERESRNTIENVFYSTRFFVDKRVESTIVCTDKYHGKRFEMLFGVAKDDKILPKDFNIEIFSEGIDLAYNWTKSEVAYLKDYIKTFNGLSRLFKKS